MPMTSPALLMPSRSARPKSARRLQVLVVQAGFEAGHDRPAGADVVADLLALAVAEHGNVRQKQGTVFAEPFGVEAVFVYEVEGESAVEQRRIDAVCRLAHVVRERERPREPDIEAACSVP